MGAINNAFNQAAGAVAGAALAIEHAKETDFSKAITAENSALVARNQSRAADAEANEAFNEAYKKGGLVSQLDAAKAKETFAKESLDKAEKRKNGSVATRVKKYSELVAAEEAANTLRDKYKAVTDMIDRANEQKEHAIKATKLALEAQQKYQSRWGGTK